MIPTDIVTVTPNDNGAGGTFTPATVMLSRSAPTATFKYTPSSVGDILIRVTNNKGLTDPSSLTHVVPVPALTVPHLRDNLISYWKLDEASGTRNDTQGTNHLSAVGATIGATGIINNGAKFVNAANQFLTIANNSSLQVTGDFTFSLWVKFTSQILSIPLAKWDAPGIDYGIVYNTTTGFEFGVNQNAGGDPARVGTPVANGVWTHLVAWYDSVTGQVYLRVNDTTTYHSSAAPALVQTTAAFTIGNCNNSAFSIEGLVDEVGFWKRKLNAAEMTALYNGGAGLAYSSFTSAYTITDTTVSGQNVRIIVPPVRVAHTAIVYCHGLGETVTVGNYFNPVTSDKSRYMQDALAAGYLLAAGDFHVDQWSNATAQADIEALVAYLLANYGVTKIVLWSQSAGGSLGLLKATQGFTGVTVSGWFGIFPVVDLDVAHGNAALTASINAAFPSYPTDAVGRDPIDLAAASYNGLRLRCCGSTADTAVPVNLHGDALVTLTTGHATETTCIHTTGNHGDASNFTQARSDDFIAFLNRCF